MSDNKAITKDEIETLIPHSGAMCLLDEVIQWDEKKITCISRSHLDTNNPFCRNHHLSVYALIEYGAQAMAVHGGLLNKRLNNTINEGYLAALRDVQIKKNNISDIESELYIEATQQMASEGNMIYESSITAENEIILSGRATVIAVYHKNE